MKKYSVIDTGELVETDEHGKERTMCDLFDDVGVALCGDDFRAFRFGGFIAEILNSMQTNAVFREQVREAMNNGWVNVDDKGQITAEVAEAVRALRTV